MSKPWHDTRSVPWSPVRPTTLDEHRRLGWNTELVLDMGQIHGVLSVDEPLVFVVSPAVDLFAGGVSTADLDTIFAVMLAHAVLEGPSCHFILTTRHATALHAYLTASDPWEMVGRWARAGDGVVVPGPADERFSDQVVRMTALQLSAGGPLRAETLSYGNLQAAFPLPNVYAGVHVATQSDVDREVPKLNDSPLVARFVQMAPCEALDFSFPVLCDRLGGAYPFTLKPEHRTQRLHMLDWIALEDGHDASASWLIELREQCLRDGIAFEGTSAPSFVQVQDTAPPLECQREVA